MLRNSVRHVKQVKHVCRIYGLFVLGVCLDWRKLWDLMRGSFKHRKRIHVGWNTKPTGFFLWGNWWLCGHGAWQTPNWLPRHTKNAFVWRGTKYPKVGPMDQVTRGTPGFFSAKPSRLVLFSELVSTTSIRSCYVLVTPVHLFQIASSKETKRSPPWNFSFSVKLISWLSTSKFQYHTNFMIIYLEIIRHYKKPPTDRPA